MHKGLIVLYSLLTLSALVGLYFFRDFLFINTNSQMKYLTEAQQMDPSLVMNWTHSRMEAFFEGWSYSNLVSFKWMMTFFFTGAFALISAIGIRLISNGQMAFITAALFGAVMLISVSINFLGNYRVARDLIGIAHGPILFLLMLCVCYIQPYIKQHEGSDSV